MIFLFVFLGCLRTWIQICLQGIRKTKTRFCLLAATRLDVMEEMVSLLAFFGSYSLSAMGSVYLRLSLLMRLVSLH